MHAFRAPFHRRLPERRETRGTLGLLFLTDLTGYDVVLGKMAATSVSAFYGLLAIVPVLAIPLLMGGVTNGEFWRTVLVLVNTFLYSLAIGVFGSVLSRDSRQAMGTNLLLLLMLAAMPAVAMGFFAYLDPRQRFFQELCFTCPAYTYYYCFDAFYRLGPQYYWLSLGVTHALTWLLIASTSWLVPHAWQDQQFGKRVGRWKEWWQRLVYGKPARRKALRTRLLEINAFSWLSSRAWLKVAGVWVFLGFVGGWWVYMRLLAGMNWTDEPFSLTTALLLNSVLKVWIGIEAGQCLAEQQKMGTLELLFSTPLDEKAILRGQVLALKRQFLKPLVVVIGVELLFLFVLRQFSYVSAQDSDRQIAFGLAGIASLILDVMALTCVAMTSALTAKTPNQASVTTFLRVLILPWAVFAAVTAVATFVLSGKVVLDWQFYLHLWFWLGLAADLGFGLPAFWQLRTRFRELALRRFIETREPGRPAMASPAPPRTIIGVADSSV